MLNHRAFDTDGKITQVDNASGASLKNYSYDDAFRITGIAEAADSTLSWTYGYDNLDRLNSATKTGTTQGWTYDANGNRLTQTGSTPSTYTNSGASNRVSSISGSLPRTYAYDAAGNTLSYAGATFTYNNRGRMATATNAGVTATYTYTALGQRIRKAATSGTTLYVYDEAGHLAGEYTAAGALIQETVWLGDIPVATLRLNGSGGVILYYVHADHLNTPRLVTDTSNNIRWRWDSDPFGTTIPNEDPSGLGLFAYNLRFPGQQYDAVVGLHYNYFRDYDPAVGRYTESDPIGQDGGNNPYGYVGGNPLLYSDPFGLKKICVVKRMLVTAYDDIGPGRDWSYYKHHPEGVGPGTIAVADTRPTPYPFGATFDVLNEDGSLAYSGVARDTGKGWDRKHHNVKADEWIDIWLPPTPGAKDKHANARQWGKQWRSVQICTEVCENESESPRQLDMPDYSFRGLR